MERIFVTFWLIISCITINAQSVLRLDTIIVLDEMTKTEIFKRSKLWFYEQVREDGQSCLQYEDKDDGILFGRTSHVFLISNTVSQWVNKLAWVPYVGKKAKKINDVASWAGLSGDLTATIEIRVKERKCKVSMTHINHKSKADAEHNDMSMGILYGDVPANLGVLKQKQYDVLLSFALPTIEKWWDEIISSLTFSFNEEFQDDNW